MTDAGMTLDRAQDKISQMQARAGAIDELIDSGALPDALGGGKDDIQAQLDATSQAGQVDSELAALKAQLGTAPATGGALPTGSEGAGSSTPDPSAPAGGAS
jgi:phage shock protein A